MNDQLQQYFESLQDDHAFQFHLRGTAGSGKSTLLTALADKVEASGTAFTHRGRLLYRQGRIIRCHLPAVPTSGPAPADAPAAKPEDAAVATAPWPEMMIDGETFAFPLDGQSALGVAFPNDPEGGLDSRFLAEYYQDPRRVFVPVFHFLRANHEVARRAYPNLISDMHDASAEDADLRVTMVAAYSVAFQKPRALVASGVDGLEEMLADERLIGAPLRDARRPRHARYRIPELRGRLAPLSEIILAVADNVVDLEYLAIQPYREVLHNLADRSAQTHRDQARPVFGGASRTSSRRSASSCSAATCDAIPPTACSCRA